MSLDRLREEMKQIAPLKFATSCHGHDAFDVARAARRLRSEAAFAPKDEGAQCALGEVVRWLDTGCIDAGPQRRAHTQDVSATALRLRMAALRALLEQRLNTLSKEVHVTGEHAGAQGSSLYVTPEPEHIVRVSKQFVRDPAGCPAALGDPC